MVLPLDTGKTFLFFKEQGTVVEEAWDRDEEREGIKSKLGKCV